jgi:hypothetical protein
MFEEIQRQGMLLSGEDPLTAEPGDIALWIAVYSELLRTVSSVLSQVDVKRSDRRQLALHQQRLEARLAYWRSRAAAPGMGPSVQGAYR